MATVPVSVTLLPASLVVRNNCISMPRAGRLTDGRPELVAKQPWTKLLSAVIIRRDD
jgi:hypothetical protein